MVASKKKMNSTRRTSVSKIQEGPSDEELLMMYLRLSGKERTSLFVDTARAAELTDLSQRTIQLWIETGAIRAVPVGKKYQIYLQSLGDYLMKQAKKNAG